LLILYKRKLNNKNNNPAIIKAKLFVLKGISNVKKVALMIYNSNKAPMLALNIFK